MWSRVAERRRARALAKDRKTTALSMECALSFARQAQDWRFQLVEHSTRVSRLARHLAEHLALAEENSETLRHVAELHEIGMIAVPAELIRARRALSAEELRRVREQAAIGSAIVRAAYPACKGELIAHQYDDFVRLRTRFGRGTPELLMAGILRVADVFDTLNHPRPYQKDVPRWRWMELLEEGAGTRFHPDAAECLLGMPPEVVLVAGGSAAA